MEIHSKGGVHLNGSLSAKSYFWHLWTLPVKSQIYDIKPEKLLTKKMKSLDIRQAGTDISVSIYLYIFRYVESVKNGTLYVDVNDTVWNTHILSYWRDMGGVWLKWKWIFIS